MADGMSTGARYIKVEINELVGTWGMAAILEVLHARVVEEMKEQVDEEYRHSRKLAAALKQAELLAD